MSWLWRALVRDGHWPWRGGRWTWRGGRWTWLGGRRGGGGRWTWRGGVGAGGGKAGHALAVAGAGRGARRGPDNNS